jgi:hypothetical protein
LLFGFQPGDSVEIEYLRDGESERATVRLAGGV